MKLTYRIQLADATFLQADKKGGVLLQINDVLYEPQDIVPRNALPVKTKVKLDARSYVLTCCIHEYGPNHSRWPELARSFVDGDGQLHPEFREKTLKSSA